MRLLALWKISTEAIIDFTAKVIDERVYSICAKYCMTLPNAAVGSNVPTTTFPRLNAVIKTK